MSLLEELFTCCSCKKKDIRRCICCESEIFSSCGCIIDKKGHQLELNTEPQYPNIILYLCNECKKKIIKNTCSNAPHY